MPTVIDAAGYQPDAVLIAEIDPEIRAIAADKHGLCIDEKKWQRTKLNIPARYVSDVWEIVRDNARALRELFVIASHVNKVVLIGGSPCQDLTFMSKHSGILGVTGDRSFHFHVFVAIIVAVRAVNPAAEVFIVSRMLVV
jgi:site-specific DNA-cytosine methylase